MNALSYKLLGHCILYTPTLCQQLVELAAYWHNSLSVTAGRQVGR